ncbi:helix-turn-helix domain-containing protein [Streptomyces malaysiensis]|uniref:helix-turn-helix domain-containing protein n=1 Tax=Streptomyces malaysiensis TaxID=92644 RepID=UPI00384C9CA3
MHHAYIVDPRNIDLRLLVILEAVHRCGSLAAAAKDRSLSRATVSHALGPSTCA